MMKFFSAKNIFQYFLPGTLTLFMCVTVERAVNTDIGGYDRLYGMPLPFISSNYAFTHHYDVYVLSMIIDLLLYFIATLLFFKLLLQAGIKLGTHWIPILIGVIITAFWISLFAMTTFESTFKLVNDFPFTTTTKQLYLGWFPK